MLHTIIAKCTRQLQRTSHAGMYVSLLALVVLAGCASTSGAGATPTDTPAAPAATATSPAATATTPANATMVKITGANGNYSFSPASVTVKVGDTVEWVNNTSVPHTSTSDSGSSVTWDSSAISSGGGTYSMTFTAAGTYKYHCSFHPFMHGEIIVTA